MLDGRRITGRITARDEQEALDKLRDICPVILELEKTAWRTAARTSAAERFKDKELALICSQFSVILATGLPLLRCVEMVASQSRSKRTRAMLSAVARSIEEGHTLAQSFALHAPGLPRAFIENLRAGESSGMLLPCFQRLYRQYDSASKIRSRIVSALTYPAMVIAVAAVVFFVVMLVAVPAFADTFSQMGATLPAITRLLIAASDLLRRRWLWLLSLAAMLALAVALFIRSDRGRLWTARFLLLRAPLRRLSSMSVSGQFAATVATLLSSGLTVPDALAVAAQAQTNAAFRAAVESVERQVRQGQSVARAMEPEPLFSRMLVEMVAMGEQSGTLEQTLTIVSTYFDSAVHNATARLLSLLEPVVTLLLAAVVVVLLLAVYLPMFSLYGGVV